MDVANTWMLQTHGCCKHVDAANTWMLQTHGCCKHTDVARHVCAAQEHRAQCRRATVNGRNGVEAAVPGLTRPTGLPTSLPAGGHDPICPSHSQSIIKSAQQRRGPHANSV
eukprot:358289-Chlamydomonas_euryale.AAC.5